jgi:transcriptional regulator with XRE-family HTH domain
MELRTARQIAGLNQTELARRAGVDNSFISMLESGKRHIHTTDYITVVRIARALNCAAEQLFPIADEELGVPAEIAAAAP